MKNTIKEVKKEIRNLKESTTDGQVKPGIYIKTIGRKYVHLLNVHDGSNIDKLLIDTFYNTFIANDYRDHVYFF